MSKTGQNMYLASLKFNEILDLEFRNLHHIFKWYKDRTTRS